jgi:hypothetical protein
MLRALRLSTSPLAPTETTPDDITNASAVSGEIKRLMAAGERDAAGLHFSALVDLQHLRKLRIAYHYLHDPDEELLSALKVASTMPIAELRSLDELTPFPAQNDNC